MATATKTKKAEETAFISKALDQSIAVRSGSDALRNTRGELVEPADPGFYPHFEAGRLTTEMLRAQARNVGIEDEEKAAQDAIEMIRGLDHFNVSSTNGIWEEGHAPDEASPTVDEQNERIAKATARSDTDELRRIKDEEADTHKRTVVLRAAQHALDALEDSE